ncbi:MAG: O-antigen ligase family protein [Phycisphaeraceae bacterium]|nr:MAG: O-antigen ligase family protein [Phycisphaeraceae bacterium]
MSGSTVATAAPAAPLPPDCENGVRIGLTTPRVIALLLILFPTLLRVLLINDPFPIWDVSPFKFPAPSVGVPPTLAMTLDVMAIIGAALALIVSGARVRLIEPLLLAAGAIAVALHALFIDGGSLDNLRIGSCWVSALAAGIGIRHLASDPIIRRWVFTLVLGASMPLAVHSLVQVFVEHPATVASYRANPSSFLDARGWTPGSAMARNYERRLMQPEATGWFGMANVHATFAAAFVIGWVGVVVAPAIERRLSARSQPRNSATRTKGSAAGASHAIRGEPILIGLMVMLAIVMLLLTRSKGGFAACVLGLALLGIGWAVVPRVLAHWRVCGSDRKSRVIELIPPLLGPAVAAGMIGLIALRGMIGTSIGELSLLFRWFYISAATRIFGEQPLLGVGPADFRPAYELAKNPLSPEEVTSPHSVVFDWASMLGVGGIAWTVILLGWTMALGYGVFAVARSREPAAQTTTQSGLRARSSLGMTGWAFAIIGLSCLTAFIIELGGYADVLPMGTRLSDMAIVISQSRLPGMILWLLATALLIARPIDDLLLKRTLGCVGISLLASACIDVAPVWPNSAALFFVMLGLAASENVAPEDRPTRRERATGMFAASILLLTATPMVWAGPRVIEWEREIIDAGTDARHIGMLSIRLDAINNQSPLRGDSLELWRLDADDPSSPDRSRSNRELLNRKINRSASDAAGVLLNSHARLSGDFEIIPGADFPLVGGPRKFTHERTLNAACETALIAVEAAMQARSITLSTVDKEALDQGVSRSVFIAKVAAHIEPPSSSSYGSLARAHLRAATIRGLDSPGGKEAMSAAISAFERAASLDPHGITYPLQLFELGRQTGDRDLARKWAEELLRRNENMRLDPVRALTPEQVSRAEAALRPSP